MPITLHHLLPALPSTRPVAGVFVPEFNTGWDATEPSVHCLSSRLLPLNAGVSNTD